MTGRRQICDAPQVTRRTSPTLSNSSGLNWMHGGRLRGRRVGWFDEIDRRNQERMERANAHVPSDDDIAGPDWAWGVSNLGVIGFVVGLVAIIVTALKKAEQKREQR